MTEQNQNKNKFQPRDYQLPIIESIINHCRKPNNDPAFVDISVGGGKTAIYAFIADHVAKKGGKVLVLARQGELVEQNSNFAWKAGVDNSVYSASLKRKSMYYNTIYGTEGTIARQICECGDFGYTLNDNGMMIYKWIPDLIMIDECLTGKTLIKTNQGYRRIDDPKLKYCKIYCIDESTGKEALDIPVRVFSNGIRNISLVKFKGGELECTNTHKLYSRSSWVRVKNLKVGQMITLDASRDFVLTKLLRASVAVVKRLFQAVKN